MEQRKRVIKTYGKHRKRVVIHFSSHSLSPTKYNNISHIHPDNIKPQEVLPKLVVVQEQDLPQQVQESSFHSSHSPVKSVNKVLTPITTPSKNIKTPDSKILKKKETTPSTIKSLKHQLFSPSPNRKVSSIKFNSSPLQTKRHFSPLKSIKSVSINNLLHLCQKKSIISFKRFFQTLTKSAPLVKIGEATYSEVYSSTVNNQKVAIKVLPFDGVELVNGFTQQSLFDVFQEVNITKILGGYLNGVFKDTSLNFVGLVDCAVVHGPYPEKLLEQWDLYDEEKESENDRPDYFPNDQLFIVLTLMHGGDDLEHYQRFDSWKQVKCVLAQLLFSLGTAEKLINFEHRDLHWGNLLLRPHKEKVSSYKLDDGTVLNIHNGGIKITIIDFTLSRLEHAGRLFSINLDDEDFYTGSGDYQFDIYRLMRKETSNKWDSYFPKTNIFWIHYLADKIIDRKITNSMKDDTENVDLFKDFMNRLLNYENCFEAFNDAYLKDCFYVTNDSREDSGAGLEELLSKLTI